MGLNHWGRSGVLYSEVRTETLQVSRRPLNRDVSQRVRLKDCHVVKFSIDQCRPSFDDQTLGQPLENADARP